jgi:branched-chain amino acid transport system substrate-binding protein
MRKELSMPQPAKRPAVIAGLAGVLVVAVATLGWLGGFAGLVRPATAPIRIGAVFPVTSNAAALAVPELTGVRIAADLVNQAGGVAGRPVELEVRDLESAADADRVMADLKASGVQLVIGAYSSDLSIAASAAADRAGLLYWEAGAVADRLTGRGLPLVFRVGAAGSNLGANSAAFAASQLAPRLGKSVSQLRVAIAVAQDAYATSVADAAEATATALGMPIVIRRSYNLAAPDWPSVMADLAASKPDVLILASHIPDGVAFRRAMLASGLKVGALIGSTMAECDPDFAGALGADAVGIFASDRPTSGFRSSALSAEARATYARFAAAWAREGGATGATSAVAGGEAAPNGLDAAIGYGTASGAGSGGGSGAAMGYGSTTQPSGSADRDEEALAGFSAAWALFHDVLPGPAAAGTLDPQSVAAAARAVDLPAGSLPNGAGLHFSTDPATLGQNDRAAAVIWQWQAPDLYAFVWPPAYATGSIGFVPLQR